MKAKTPKRMLFLAGLMILQSSLAYSQSYQDTYKLENFEGQNYVVRPNSTSYTKYEWGFPNSDNAGNTRDGEVEFTTQANYGGDQSLRATILSLDSSISNTYNVQNIFFHYYPYDDERLEYRYIREQEAHKGKTGYQVNRFNRLRFWVKVPSSHVAAQVRQTNFHFGTYIRNVGEPRNSSESDNGHFYHYYNLPNLDGVWHQIIVDTHPSHQRGASGNTEHGDHEYPLGGTYNYFDLMTRFYVQIKSKPTEYPTTYYIDDFEFYYDPNPENVDQIYSLHGSYSQANNTIVVGWVRDKTEDDVKHEVRYSFNDIHDIGWNAATVAPGASIIDPPGMGGYNGMEYRTDQINVGSNSAVYIAIKPQNSSLFRQIVIPVGGAVAEQSPPLYPANISGQGGTQ